MPRGVNLRERVRCRHSRPYSCTRLLGGVWKRLGEKNNHKKKHTSTSSQVGKLGFVASFPFYLLSPLHYPFSTSPAKQYSETTSHRLPGADALTYLTKRMACVSRRTKLSALLAANTLKTSSSSS